MPICFLGNSCVVSVFLFSTRLVCDGAPHPAGSFNDPDMLVVGLDGMVPYGNVQECPPHVANCKPGDYISRERCVCVIAGFTRGLCAILFFGASCLWVGVHDVAITHCSEHENAYSLITHYLAAHMPLAVAPVCVRLWHCCGFDVGMAVCSSVTGCPWFVQRFTSRRDVHRSAQHPVNRGPLCWTRTSGKPVATAQTSRVLQHSSRGCTPDLQAVQGWPEDPRKTHITHA